MTTDKKIAKSTLNKSFWRWWYGNLTCFSHEHMQTFGYMWSMLPIIQELYATKEEQAQKLRTYY
ncbi:MAG: PTS system mannose/fructose/sorbose family transporter subunit IID, partial [Erysipelotrichia bacterium]|nr:PTS system mannose/fructose/sorbose family transporter subunit IID [Erysipelotrichia bacterium]